MPHFAAAANPTPTSPAGTVRLKPRKARPFYARHPWVLKNAIASASPDLQSGDVVDLVNDRGEFIARGIYHGDSRIAVRLYTWNREQLLDSPFWRRAIEQAIELRRSLGFLADPQAACRVIFSEADGLSGLIVDRYGPYLVVQLNSLGMARRVELILDLLADLLEPVGMIVRTDSAMVGPESIDLPEITRGEIPLEPITIIEHGLEYRVDLRHGQKTGFYLDQRDNRLAAAALLEDRTVLDLFCYSGSFGLNALVNGRAREVLAVDSSARAIEWARQNATLNQVDRITFEQANVFGMLDRLKEQGRKFGAVILDPPRFSRSRRTINEAIRAYHRINRVAIDLIEDQGILVTCSCSGSISPEDFALILAGVAEKARCDLKMLQRRGAAPDHPVRTACLENEYLKCIIARVTR